MPTIAGLVTVSQQGFIDCVNDQLSKALIGRSQDDLIGIDITDIIPTFWGFIKDMEWELREMNQKEPFIHSPRCQLADYDPSSCAHSPSSSRNSCVQCTSKPRLVNLRHRDGSLLPVSIQGRIWKPSNAEDPLYAIWLNFSKEEAPLIETLAVETTTDYKTNKEQFPLASPGLIPNISKKQVKPIFTKHKIEDFEVIKALGEGAHSYVKLCSLKSDPTVIIINHTVLHDLKEKSPLLPNMLHFFYDDFFYFLITEYTNSTDLFEYIESSNLAENSIKRIYKQVLEAIGIIHSMDIVHRDLKVTLPNRRMRIF
ncbi:Calcium-dependent protein kinase 4 [Boothiomyces sp. JEL0838]|nr:Calcium-dependent protein kinase 4 [Boothiomyces sp. JEL0838]